MLKLDASIIKVAKKEYKKKTHRLISSQWVQLPNIITI